MLTSLTPKRAIFGTPKRCVSNRILSETDSYILIQTSHRSDWLVRLVYHMKSHHLKIWASAKDCNLSTKWLCYLGSKQGHVLLKYKSKYEIWAIYSILLSHLVGRRSGNPINECDESYIFWILDKNTKMCTIFKTFYGILFCQLTTNENKT